MYYPDLRLVAGGRGGLRLREVARHVLRQRGTSHLSWEGKMDEVCGERALLGRVLVEQGAVNHGEVEFALKTQVETGERLGKILVDLGLVCRPALARALAGQSGVELREERGFGTGLRAQIERRHGYRRDARG